MSEVITIGLDISKSIFHVHGVDGSGNAVTRRQLRRSQVLPFFKKLPPCLVGIEACASLGARDRGAGSADDASASREGQRNKNDMADAEAICEAVTRPTMRFVEIKTPNQQ